MSLFDKVKARLKREPVSLEESASAEPERPNEESQEDLNLRPRPATFDEQQLPLPQEIPIAQQPQQLMQNDITRLITHQLELINSKVDLIKVQIESLNQSIRIINAKLR